MADSIILDHNGKPFQKKALAEEIATASLTGIRNVWNWGSEAEFISPDRLGNILRAAAEGDANAYLTLAEEMEERDPHYGSVLGTRKRALTGLPVTVEAVSDDAQEKEIADAVLALTESPEFGDMVDELMDAISKGYSVVEINWDTKRTPWVPRTRIERKDGKNREIEAYSHRDPRFFMYDRETGKELRLIDEEDPFNGIPLIDFPHRFIVHEPRLKTGLQIRAGLARLVATAYMCKAYTLTDWMRFAEVFGLPIRVGKYGPGATPQDIQTLINAVANIGTDAAAAIPDSMRIEFESAGAGQGGPDMFKNLAEYLDRQVSKAVLGQTASTEGTAGKLGNEDAQNDVRLDILKSDAKQLSNTLNKYLVRSFVELNWGKRDEYPRIVMLASDPEDTTALVSNVKTAVELGAKISAKWLRDKVGAPDPEEDDELLSLTPAAQQTTPGAASPNGPSSRDLIAGSIPPQGVAQNHQHSEQHSHCPACHGHRQTARNAEQTDQSEEWIDELIDIGLSNWQQQIDPVLQPIKDLLDSVTTVDEFAAGLRELSEEADDSALIEQLAVAMFRARGMGDAGV